MEFAKVVAIDWEAADRFGRSVSAFGNHAIIGAPYEDENEEFADSLDNAGAAYLLEMDSTGIWSIVQKIVPSDREDNDYFGNTVDISQSHAIIGAPYEDENPSGIDSINQAGSCYIYRRGADGVWHQQQKIVASDRDYLANFGSAVAIDGDMALVAASTGAVYAFRRDSSDHWIEFQQPRSTDWVASDAFGFAVSLSGTRAVIGAHSEDHDAAGGSTKDAAGSAYVFDLNGSQMWAQTQKIVASDRAAYDRFGWNVTVQDSVIVVGAPHEDHDVSGNNDMDGAGSAYIFRRNVSGVWIQEAKITPTDRHASAGFGRQLSVHGDRLLIGAPGESMNTSGGNFMNGAGAAYVFERGGLGTWMETQKLVASDREPIDNFGDAVGLTDSIIIVGALFEDDNGPYTANDAGAVYLFGRCDTGISVSVSGHILTCGSPGTYQWLDCDNHFGWIAGATGPVLTPTVPGSYAVVVARYQCLDTSACTTVAVPSGITETAAPFNVFPNPSRGAFNLDVACSEDQLHVVVLDQLGRHVGYSIVKDPGTTRISINVPPGLYLLRAYCRENVLGTETIAISH
jgi:hypothetical protein